MLVKRTRETLFALKGGDFPEDTMAYATVTREWSPTDVGEKITVKIRDVFVDLSTMEEKDKKEKEWDIHCFRRKKEWMRLGREEEKPYAEIYGIDIPDDVELRDDKGIPDGRPWHRYCHLVYIVVRLLPIDGEDDESICHTALALARELLLTAFPGAIFYIPFYPMVDLRPFRVKLREDATYNRTIGDIELHGEAFVARNEREETLENSIFVYLTGDAKIEENYLSDDEKWLLVHDFGIDDGRYKDIYCVKSQTIDDMETNFLGASAIRMPNFTKKYFGFFQFLLQTIEECISKKH